MDSQSDNEAEEEVRITSTVGPAYAVDGYATKGSTGVHCSASDEYCFFCTYQANADAVGTDADLYGNLVDMAKAMSASRKEPTAIAYHVSRAYIETVKPHIPGTPSWSTESILRHLLYSNSFPAVFEDGVTSMFTSLIARQNSALVDTTTNQVRLFVFVICLSTFTNLFIRPLQVIEENRKNFCHTVDCFLRWGRRKPTMP
jgi:hypothetical protein